MKVLMLGWEYPPHIAGGLGVACEGLTRALARNGMDITFVMPHLTGDEDASHMQLIDPNSDDIERVDTIERLTVPAMLQPYWNEVSFDEQKELLYRALNRLSDQHTGRAIHYGNNIFEEVALFTHRVLERLPDNSFDVIHAHDWMTFPAGQALAARLNIPLITHVHSLEYDRSGKGANDKIKEIEYRGMHAASRVIAVSEYTRKIASFEYNVPIERIEVVHNGRSRRSSCGYKKLDSDSKMVLFLGRLTFQKGPDYFIRTAARVIPHVPDVKFVLAGAGDMYGQLAELVYELGIQDYVEFTGFLNGEEVENIFSRADLYVMPSVSEPFGLSALEAIDFETPALISNQSGVKEVLKHSLSFDFWDTERLANLIISSLKYDELRSDMVTMARKEIERLQWDAAASKTCHVYQELAYH